MVENLAGIDIKIIENNMVIVLSCSVEVLKRENFMQDLQAHLELKKITARLDLTALKESISRAVKDSTGLDNLRIAKGVLPVEPVHGEIKWTRDYFKCGYAIDPETKRVDFHQMAGDPSVKKDDLLVQVFHAKKGKEGCDVFGRTIEVGKPKEVKLKKGSNVYWDEDAKGFRAECDGRVKLRGCTLSVDPVYIARNGIGTETGNIKHFGQVIVDGDVDADFKLEATDDIEIRGLAYACDIVCGGNLVVREGINGGPDKEIIVTGDVMAKYLQNTVFRVQGDITVNTEIYQCRIETEGAVNCHSGRIIGGEITAIGGIVAGEAGSKGNVRTILAAGVDKKLHEEIKLKCEEISRLKETVKKLAMELRKYRAYKHHLNDEQKETMTEMEFKIAESEEKMAGLEEEKNNLKECIREKGKAKIRILELANPGVVLRIGDVQYSIESELGGPIIAMLDPLTGQIALTSEDEKNENTSLRDESTGGLKTAAK